MAKYEILKAIVKGGVVLYMRTHQVGHTYAKDRINRILTKYPTIEADIARDAQLRRLVRFERRHPKAFLGALTGRVGRAAKDADVSSGALYVENNRLIAFAASLSITQSRAVKQVEKIAREQGPLLPSKAGRPKRGS